MSNTRKANKPKKVKSKKTLEINVLIRSLKHKKAKSPLDKKYLSKKFGQGKKSKKSKKNNK